MTYELKINPIYYNEDSMKELARNALWRFRNVGYPTTIYNEAMGVLADKVESDFGADLLEATDDDSWLNFVSIITKEAERIAKEEPEEE